MAYTAINPIDLLANLHFVSKMIHVTFITATRMSADQFWNVSPLGISLKRLSSACVLRREDIVKLPVHYSWDVEFENHKGLPEVYNQGIETYILKLNNRLLRVSRDDNHNIYQNQVLVFAHDDIWIDDACIGEHLIAGLNEYDVIGIAGSQSRYENQASWCFVDPGRTITIPNASGLVSHGSSPFGNISYYGPSNRQCELLDGVFMAVGLRTLSEHPKLRFDSRFNFHFYDMDFCRTASLLGLRMGTWPISITHQSGGSLGVDVWQKAYEEYLAKWGN